MPGITMSMPSWTMAVPSSLVLVPCSQFPGPSSLFLVPCSMVLVLCSWFPVPSSRFPGLCSLFLIPSSLFSVPLPGSLFLVPGPGTEGTHQKAPVPSSQAREAGMRMQQERQSQGDSDRRADGVTGLPATRHCHLSPDYAAAAALDLQQLPPCPCPCAAAAQPQPAQCNFQISKKPGQPFQPGAVPGVGVPHSLFHPRYQQTRVIKHSTPGSSQGLLITQHLSSLVTEAGALPACQESAQ